MMQMIWSMENARGGGSSGESTKRATHLEGPDLRGTPTVGHRPFELRGGGGGGGGGLLWLLLWPPALLCSLLRSGFFLLYTAKVRVYTQQYKKVKRLS